ncbi:protein E1 [Elephant endotheliotropic herpesvirus 6]|nr:protein E1 [Elephant endotheliotropic herpesvirus 6]
MAGTHLLAPTGRGTMYPILLLLNIVWCAAQDTTAYTSTTSSIPTSTLSTPTSNTSVTGLSTTLNTANSSASTTELKSASSTLLATSSDVSSSAPGSTTGNVSDAASSTSPTSATINAPVQPACTCPPQILDPNKTYTYLELVNVTGAQNALFTCTFNIKYWSSYKNYTADRNDTSTRAPDSTTPDPHQAEVQRYELLMTKIRLHFQISVTIVGLITLIITLFIPLAFRSRLLSLIFPRNTKALQFLIVLGVILLFTISILAWARGDVLPSYIDQLVFLICYSALFVNACNVFLMYKFSVNLPGKALMLCGLFCFLVGGVSVFTCYQVRKYLDLIQAHLITLGINEYTFVGSSLTKVDFLEPWMLTNLHLIGSICPNFFLFCAIILSAVVYKRSKYTHILFVTCVVLAIVHTVHVKVLRTPEVRLWISCGYMFLICYIVPVIVSGMKPIRTAFFKSGTDDTKSLLAHEEKNV